jgi:hypothetical protein
MSNNHILAIDRKIKATNEEINNIQSSLNHDSFEYFMLINELNNRLIDLNNEKEKIQQSFGREKLTLVLSGNGVGSGIISNRILSSILQGIQQITDSIANSIGNEPSLKGKIPNSILAQTDFKICNVFKGSFGIELEGDISEKLTEEESLLTQTLHKFYDLLNTSNDSVKITEEITCLGPRTLVHYKEWLKTINEFGVDVRCDWNSSNAESYKWSTDHIKLADVLNTLESIKEIVTEDVVMTGIVTGMNIRKETFEFTPTEGEVITGKSKFELLFLNRDLIGEKTIISLVKNTMHNNYTGQEKVTWFLTQINKI